MPKRLETLVCRCIVIIFDLILFFNFSYIVIYVYSVCTSPSLSLSFTLLDLRQLDFTFTFLLCFKQTFLKLRKDEWPPIVCLRRVCVEFRAGESPVRCSTAGLAIKQQMVKSLSVSMFLSLSIVSCLALYKYAVSANWETVCLCKTYRFWADC